MFKEKLLIGFMLYGVLSLYFFLPEKMFLMYLAVASGAIAMFYTWRNNLLMITASLWMTIFAVDKLLQSDVFLASVVISLTPISIFFALITEEMLVINPFLMFVDWGAKVLSFFVFLFYCLIHFSRPLGDGPLARFADVSTSLSENMLLFLSAAICIQLCENLILGSNDEDDSQCYPGCQFDESCCPGNNEKRWW